MLLKMETLRLLKPDGDEKFKAKSGLSEKQREMLRLLDEDYFVHAGEHLITNYNDLT